MDDQVLRDYFKFNESDLAANRMGEFSVRQKLNLAKELKENTKNGTILGWSSLVIVLLLVLISIVFSQALGAGIYVTVIFALICGGFGYLGLRSAANTRRGDISKDIVIVNQMTGPIRIEGGRGSDMYFFVKDQSFEISQEVADSITQGDIYVLYIGGRNQNFLSMEWISKG